MASNRPAWANYAMVLAKKAEPIVNTKHMHAAKKKVLWQAIKIKRPKLAEMMTSDSGLLAIKDLFDGDFVFTQTEIDALILDE